MNTKKILILACLVGCIVLAFFVPLTTINRVLIVAACVTGAGVLLSSSKI